MKNRAEFYFLRVIYLLSGITVALYIYSLFHRPIHVDTAILGEPVFWLGKEGILRSELQRGWFHAEEHFFFTHKLFLYIGAAWTSLLGWSAVILDSLSLVYFALLLLAWWFLAKEKTADVNRPKEQNLPFPYFILFFLLLISNHHIYELSFVFRPEVALAACGSWAFYFLHRFLRTENLSSFLLASVLAAIGLGHHLNGVIFIAAGFALLVYHRKYIPAISYGLIGALGFGFYFLDIRSLADFNLMISQLFNMQDIQNEHKTWIHYVLNLPKEQSRFFHSPVEIGFTLLIFPTIILNFRQLWREHRDLIVYTFSAMAALALISHDKDTKYLALNIPALTFLSVVAIKNFFRSEILTDSRSWIPLKLVPVLVVLFLIGQWRSNSTITFHPSRGADRFDRLTKDLPDGLNVMGPTLAVFWAIPHHQRYQSPIVYKILDSHNMFVLGQEPLEQALEQNQIDAVIIDKEFLKIFKMPGPQLKNYTVFSEDPDEDLFLLRKNK